LRLLSAIEIIEYHCLKF